MVTCCIFTVFLTIGNYHTSNSTVHGTIIPGSGQILRKRGNCTTYNVTLCAIETEQDVYNRLFSAYDRDIRPVNGDELTNVTIALNYFILLSMEQREELMTFSSDITKSWFDPQLQWTPSDQNSNLKRMITLEATIWKPDIAVVNGVKQDAVIQEENRFSTISYTGFVEVSIPAVYTTKCSMQLADFPFDSQVCEIHVGSWAYTASEVKLSALEEEITLNSDYKGNSEWDVTKITSFTVENDEEGQVYQELHYSIHLKRKSSYYLYVLLVPTFIVSTLSICGLFTPLNNLGDRAEKATLGLTTLLSLALMLNIVGSDMPKAATLPKLARYVLGEIIICSLGVLITIVIQLAHQRVNTREFIPSELLSKQAYEKFPKTEPDFLGLRILNSARRGEFQSALNQLEITLKNISDYISRIELREAFLNYWIRFFDRLDMIFLAIFQAASIILTLVIVFG